MSNLNELDKPITENKESNEIVKESNQQEKESTTSTLTTNTCTSTNNVDTINNSSNDLQSNNQITSTPQPVPSTQTQIQPIAPLQVSQPATIQPQPTPKIPIAALNSSNQSKTTTNNKNSPKNAITKQSPIKTQIPIAAKPILPLPTSVQQSLNDNNSIGITTTTQKQNKKQQQQQATVAPQRALIVNGATLFQSNQTFQTKNATLIPANHLQVYQHSSNVSNHQQTPIIMNANGQFQVVQAQPQLYQFIPLNQNITRGQPIILAPQTTAQQQQQQQQQQQTSNSNPLIFQVPTTTTASLNNNQHQHDTQQILNTNQYHQFQQVANNFRNFNISNLQSITVSQQQQQQQQTVAPVQIQPLQSLPIAQVKPVTALNTQIKSTPIATVQAQQQQQLINKTITQKSPIKQTQVPKSTASSTSPSAYDSSSSSSSPELDDSQISTSNTKNAQKRHSNDEKETDLKIKKHKIKVNNEMEIDGSSIGDMNVKKRGRPRLYAQDPVTGKSIKGQLVVGTLNEPQIQQVLTQSIDETHKNNENNLINDDNNIDIDDKDESESVKSDKQTTLAKQSSSSSSSVLTHIIEGFIIKESSQPFPLKQINNQLNEVSTSNQSLVYETCLECGKKDLKDKFKTKQICSSNCLKQYSKNQKNSKKCKKQEQQEDDSAKKQAIQKETVTQNGLNNNRQQVSTTTTTTTVSLPQFQTSPLVPQHNQPKQQQQQQQHNSPSKILTKKDVEIDSEGYEIPIGNPDDWNCEQVYLFVKQIAGQHVAETFKLQEVDGSALSLIKDDHLVNTMHIKLGPALKILHKFNEIKTKFTTK